MRLTGPIVSTLDDAKHERVRVNFESRIRELQELLITGWRLLGDILVPDSGSGITFSHGLGRAPQMVICSPPRTDFPTVPAAGGILVDLSGTGVDRTKQLRLFATGYGTPVLVTVAVL